MSEGIELGYWLSSEEHGPRALVDLAVEAEARGYGTALISDHFHPWVRRQGNAPFVWGVLGAIAHATTTLRVGTGVTAPIVRMHPAVVAHAAATAAVQFEGRFFLGLGTGERLSEHVTGQRWPGATERRSMLEEAVEIMRPLFDGRNVNHRGEHFRVENARLLTRPPAPVDIVVAASGRRSAQLAGRVGDGLLAVSGSPRVVEAFEAAGGAGKPRIAQLHVCWAPTEEDARRTAVDWWPQGGVTGAALADLARPEDYERLTSGLSEDAIVAPVVCGPDPDRHAAAVARLAAAGYTTVAVHQIGPDQRGFFTFYDERVRPLL